LEDIAPLLTEVGACEAVCFSPVAEIYDRDDPDFEDTPEWVARRKASRDYLCHLSTQDLAIYPFHFVWNDFDVSDLDRFCGIKWHRHQEEPRYQYQQEACGRMVEAIRERQFVVVLEEELENTLYFIRDLAQGVPVIIPHIGELNGGFRALDQADVWNLPHVFADCSCDGVGSRLIQIFLNRYGPEKLIFGSDYPFGTPRSRLDAIERLGLPDADLRLILYDNMKRLLRNTELYGLLSHRSR
jgi:hypothetical protein